MDDLLCNFATDNIDSPNENDYKYHFVNDSPAPLELDRPAHPAPIPEQPKGGEQADEGDYSADIDEDDDDFELDHDPLSRSDAYLSTPASYANDNGNSLYVNDTANLDRSYPHQNGTTRHVPNFNNNKASQDIKPPLIVRGGEQGLDEFKKHLRRFHRQDIDRDELLTLLYQENLDLKRILDESIPGSTSRAEAAERSLFEIRRSLDKSPYVCVLIDGRGYKLHEDLLQLGEQGGEKTADQLRDEVSIYFQQFGEAKDWEIIVHLYMDVGGLLARCVSNDILLSESCVRRFMLGFTQAQPLFSIVDVGHDHKKLLQKVEATFHLFANNTQCKHLLFGCCHDAAYVATLVRYATNPITASSITLLKSYESSTSFQGLPFDSVEFPSVFRSTPYKKTDRLAEDIDNIQDLPQQLDSDLTLQEVEKDGAKQVAGRDGAIAKWQATAGASWPALTPTRAPARIPSGWMTEKKVLLNINDERVDQELGEIDLEISESMLDRVEMQRFCVFYHLQGSCETILAGKPCNFRHEPRLNEHELRFLKRRSQRRPCAYGSSCRRPDCLYGHVCPSQPNCKKGPRCPLYIFHEVEKTAVRVWVPEKRQSPPKGLWRP